MDYNESLKVFRFYRNELEIILDALGEYKEQKFDNIDFSIDDNLDIFYYDENGQEIYRDQTMDTYTILDQVITKVSQEIRNGNS